jgi:hypothetical protein
LSYLVFVTQSKLFGAIVLAGVALGGCNHSLPYEGGDLGKTAPHDLGASHDMAKYRDLAVPNDLASHPDLADCFLCPTGIPICPNPCGIDASACWPCFI